jgi:hypothetical protein
MSGPRITDGIGRDRLWPHGNSTPTLRALEKAFRHSLESGGRLKNHASDLANSGKLTQSGVRDAVRQYAKTDLAPGIAKGEAAISRAKAYVKTKLADLRTKSVDPKDVVSFFKRESLRDALRQMNSEERNTMLMRHARELDAELIHAALEAVELPWVKPTERFLKPEVRDQLQRQLISAEHPEAMAEIESVSEAIKYSEPTITKARQELAAELGMNELEWASMARTATAGNEPIWLRKDGDTVRVMKPSLSQYAKPGSPLDYRNFSSPIATPEQIEAGTYFSWREYQKAVLDAGLIDQDQYAANIAALAAA